MTPERFTALLAAYGGRSERWPAAEREDARAFAATYPSARDAMAAASRLDATLTSWRVPGPGAALAARVAMIGATRDGVLQRRLRLWRSALAAAALATGFAAGAAAVALSTAAPEAGGSALYGVSVLGAPLDLEPDTGPRGPA